MLADVAGDLRKQYSRLIEMLLAIGEADHAQACALLAVGHGVWKDPLQRPADFDSRLPQLPLYDPARFWFVPFLEQHFPTIRDELLSVTSRCRDGFSPVDEPLVGAGRWEEAVFYEGGVRMERPCALYPKTAEIVSRIPDAIESRGVVMLSWLAPGTHIVAHCGGTNTKLRVHLGIRIPDGASMRVGEQRVVWEEGKCVVFDDSFEHEIWNRAPEPRVVLLFDILHPDLPDERRAAHDERTVEFESTVKDFLISRGIVGVERDPATDEIIVFPDEPTLRIVSRYMKDHNATRVQMAHGTLVID